MTFARGVRALTFVCILALAGCFGGGDPPDDTPPPPQSAVMAAFLMDAPPAGVSVLTFEITITGAVLQPGNVQLVDTPVQVNVKQNEVEASFLDGGIVPAGTYTSIAVTFSNPELTIRNDNNTAIAAACAVGAVCEFRPATSGTATYNGAPFPLTVTGNNEGGVLMDLNLSSVITGTNTVDFTAPGVLTASLLRITGTQPITQLENFKGRIVAPLTAGSGGFNLQLSSGRTLFVVFGSATTFEDFNDPLGINCAANNATCLAVGQVVEVESEFGTVLVARRIEALDNDNEEELEGIVVNTANLPVSFDMVLTEEAVNAAGVEVGQRVTVNLPGVIRYRMDSDGLTTNPADFDAANDLRIGQAVEVERRTTPAGTPPAFDSDRVTLKDARLTGRVQSVNATTNTIILDNLPGIFGVSTLEVRVTPGQTEFRNATGITALTVNDSVSVSGLLFRGGVAPFVMGKRIRKR